MENRRMKAYILLADGFEETEAIATADVLMRAGIEVSYAMVPGMLGQDVFELNNHLVRGSHNMTVKANMLLDQKKSARLLGDGDILILPGGKVGTENLKNSEAVKEAIQLYMSKGRKVCAICAAPTVLGKYGFLKGRRATCYPGFEDYLDCAEYTGNATEVDGNIITGKSMGAAITFGLRIVAETLGYGTAENVEESLYRG